MRKVKIIFAFILSISFLCLNSCKDRSVEDETVTFDSSIDGTATLPMPQIDIETAKTIVKTGKPVSLQDYTTDGTAAVQAAPAAPVAPVDNIDISGFDPNS